jgi:hypothetical protein
MSSNFYSVGLNHVGAYQVSGKPFLLVPTLPTINDESVRIQFPNVTKSITFKVKHQIKVHFAPYDLSVAPTFDFTTDASTSGNYFIVLANTTHTFDVKCKEVFFSTGNASSLNNGDVEVFAELTNIPASRMFDLEGLDGVSS